MKNSNQFLLFSLMMAWIVSFSTPAFARVDIAVTVSVNCASTYFVNDTFVGGAVAIRGKAHSILPVSSTVEKASCPSNPYGLDGKPGKVSYVGYAEDDAVVEGSNSLDFNLTADQTFVNNDSEGRNCTTGQEIQVLIAVTKGVERLFSRAFMIGPCVKDSQTLSGTMVVSALTAKSQEEISLERAKQGFFGKKAGFESQAKEVEELQSRKENADYCNKEMDAGSIDLLTANFDTICGKIDDKTKEDLKKARDAEKKTFDELKASNDLAISALRDQIVASRGEIIGGLLKEGVDLNVASYYAVPNLKLSLPKIELPAAPELAVYDQSADIYGSLAKQTLKKLEESWNSGDRIAFLFEAERYTAFMRQLTDSVQLRSIVIVGEVEALQKSFDSVQAFVQSHLGNNGFFKDSQVPVSTQVAIQIQIEPQDSARARALRIALNRWGATKLTDQQLRVVATIEVLGNTFVQLANTSGTIATNVRAKVNSIADGAVAAVSSLAQGGARISPAGDFIDFFEIATGRNFFDSKELSFSERLLTAGGLVVGTGQFWRAVGETSNTVKNTKAVAQVLRLADRMPHGVEEILKRSKVLAKVDIPDDLKKTFLKGGYEVVEVAAPIRLARYWGMHETGVLAGKGAKECGAFLVNKIYKSEAEFRKGSVVFKEWNAAKKVTIFEIQPGAKLAYGKIGEQVLPAAKSASGKIESLAESDDLQFLLLDGRLDELIASGSHLVKIVESSIETGF